MPRLQFFIPCDKAIISQENDDVSLIGIIDGIGLKVPDLGGEDGNVSFRYSWYTACQWMKEDGDDGKSFEQQVQIILPSGVPSGASVTLFTFAERSKALNITKGEGIPFSGAGTYHFRLSYRKAAGGDEPWEQINDYPFLIFTSVPTN